MEETTIVLYPSPLMGHLVSMVELGKLILTHHPSISVIVLITTAPYDTSSIAQYIQRTSTSIPSMIFHHLPTTPLPPSYNPANVEDLAFEIPRLNNPNLHQALQTISTKSKPKAFIIDFFCNASVEVSTSLNIPTYYFFTSGASDLAVFFYLQTLHETTTTSFKDLNTFLHIPGVPPIFSSDMVEPLLDRNTLVYERLLETTIQMAKSSGIIVNTFDSFEPRALKAISNGECTPNTSPPPVYCIGPLIANPNESSQEHKRLIWLDSQPAKSVVFLCFGSRGKFNKEQLKEIAVGLENSGVRFLWVVRNPPGPGIEEDKDSKPESQDPDLDELLPHGFLERTKGRGWVVNTWVPQIAVLSHEAVGGFVTHCGWNSVLEGVCAGVPMIAWPLYAEQRINRVFLVQEMKVALRLEEREDRFVTAEVLERGVRELMESDNGEMVRRRVVEMRDAAKAAREEDGSSVVALAKLIATWKESIGQ